MLPTLTKDVLNTTNIHNAPDLFVKTLEILIKKSLDYNGERARQQDFRIDDPRVDYFPFGDKSYVHMIWTKVLRIKNILETEEKPNFEGVEDSIIDLVAYSMFYWSYLQDKKKGTAKNEDDQLVEATEQVLKDMAERSKPYVEANVPSKALPVRGFYTKPFDPNWDTLKSAGISSDSIPGARMIMMNDCQGDMFDDKREMKS